MTKEEILNKHLLSESTFNEIEDAMEEYAAQEVRKALEEMLPPSDEAYSANERKYVIDGYLLTHFNTK